MSGAALARHGRGDGPVPAYRRVWEWLDRRADRVAFAAAGVVLLVGGGLSVALGSTLTYFDERLYLRYADGIARHGAYTIDGVDPSAWRPPGYPMLLGVLRWLGAGVVGLRLAGVVLLALSVLGVHALGRRIFGPAAGALAAVLTAAYPLLVYTAASLYPQVQALALLVGALLAALAALEARGRRRWLLAVLAGLASGALVLTVPTYAPALVLLLGWLALRGRARRGAAVALVVLATALVLPGAWAARNAARLHAFVPVSTNDGLNLLLGNNPGATPTSGSDADISRYAGDPVLGGLSEVRQAERFRAEAVRWIGDHPAQAAWLYVGKLANNFNFRNDYATAGSGSRVRDAVGAATYLPVLLLFLVRVALGLTRRVPFRRVEPLLVAIVLVTPLAIAVYFTRLRFRVPLDPLMIVVVAGFVGSLVGGTLRHRPAAPVASAPVPVDTGRAVLPT